MSRSAAKNSGDTTKRNSGKTDFRAKPAETVANAETRIESIKKRFGKSLAHLAK